MKNLRFLQTVFLSFFILACNSDDNQNDAPVSNDQGINAIINGGSFNDYNFIDSIYQVTKSSNNTISINTGDASGNQITLFLNSSNGFGSGTVKPMGDFDENNFVNYILVRQNNPELNYFSSSGHLTITANRAHPTENGMRLLSGNFEITANTIDDSHSIEMNGSFMELEFED